MPMWKPVEKWQVSDTDIGENAPEPGTAVGEARQRRLPAASDGVEVSVDQRLESVSVLATAPKTRRPPDFVSTLPTRTSRCRSPVSQLRMNVESSVTTTAGAIVSGVMTAHSRSASPTFRAWRRTV